MVSSTSRLESIALTDRRAPKDNEQDPKRPAKLSKPKAEIDEEITAETEPDGGTHIVDDLA